MTGYGLEKQMHDFRYDTDPARLEEREAATEGLSPIPIWPSLLQVSGLYEYRKPFEIPHPIPVPIPPTPAPGAEAEGVVVLLREELRLDVDGRYPQMTVSGTRYSLLARWCTGSRG